MLSFFFHPSASLDIAKEQFQGINANESMPSTLATLGGGWGDEHQENSHSIQPPLSFHFPLTFAFSPSPFPASPSSLLTAVIVSFSLSKNIAVLPRCKGRVVRGGGEIFPTCVLPFHLRGGRKQESWGKSGVLMTAESAGAGNAERRHLQYTH